MHSQLAAAARPYIWREVLVAFGSYNATEEGLTRLERAELPHNAPYVRALFMSFNFLGDDEDYVPQMISIISKFKSLRAVCFGTFQSYSQPTVYTRLAAAIRDHPRIDTLVIWHMAGATNLIAEGASRPYHIQFEFCHGGSAALLSKPRQIASLRLQNMERQNLAKHMPARVWESLKYLAPGYEDMEQADQAYMQSSLEVCFLELLNPSCSGTNEAFQTYIENGRKPALQALDLSQMSFYSPGREGWLKLGRKLPFLHSFTYAPRGTIGMNYAKSLLEAFRRVRRLHFVAPRKDAAGDMEELELNPDFVELLAKLPLERLILDVFVPAYLLDDHEGDPEEIGWAAVENLAETCEALESVQLRYMWEGIGCEDQRIIVEYAITRTPAGDVTLKVAKPKPLEGTILEFLDWQ
ncbi:hypothetical protein MVEN_00591100 [Mycena venus]|uniref:Uncharacterized protein n=1 Tax=Mycena venus TaxID=2733690 RepID=A0A8H6YPG7_9AGAR|nr:hypothetical protein MVEN_00591100 [Mycena venus]